MLHLIASCRTAPNCTSCHGVVHARHHASICMPCHVMASHGIAPYVMDTYLHGIALHCIALHCIALHCIALHRIALHRIALHGNAQASNITYNLFEKRFTHTARIEGNYCNPIPLGNETPSDARERRVLYENNPCSH